jgi:hypothetical protein
VPFSNPPNRNPTNKRGPRPQEFEPSNPQVYSPEDEVVLRLAAKNAGHQVAGAAA